MMPTKEGNSAESMANTSRESRKRVKGDFLSHSRKVTLRKI